MKKNRKKLIIILMIFIVLCIVAIVLLSIVKMNVSDNKLKGAAEFEFSKDTDDIDTNKKH